MTFSFKKSNLYAWYICNENHQDLFLITKSISTENQSQSPDYEDVIHHTIVIFLAWLGVTLCFVIFQLLPEFRTAMFPFESAFLAI